MTSNDNDALPDDAQDQIDVNEETTFAADFMPISKANAAAKKRALARKSAASNFIDLHGSQAGSIPTGAGEATPSSSLAADAASNEVPVDMTGDHIDHPASPKPAERLSSVSHRSSFDYGLMDLDLDWPTPDQGAWPAALIKADKKRAAGFEGDGTSAKRQRGDHAEVFTASENMAGELLDDLEEARVSEEIRKRQWEANCKGKRGERVVID